MLPPSSGSLERIWKSRFTSLMSKGTYCSASYLMDSCNCSESMNGRLIFLMITEWPDTLVATSFSLILSSATSSRIVSATAEAFILHYADYADAQLAVYEELAEETRKVGDHVSQYSPFIERRVVALETSFETNAKAQGYIADLVELKG